MNRIIISLALLFVLLLIAGYRNESAVKHDLKQGYDFFMQTNESNGLQPVELKTKQKQLKSFIGSNAGN